MADKGFLDAKKKAQDLLISACENDEVDEQVLPILERLNRSEEFYTSSSCAGRIVVLEIPSIGDKKSARFLGKWHRTIQEAELLTAVENAEKGLIWVLAQSPIFHIGTRNIKNAEKMVKLAVSCGFKNSGVKTLGKHIIVEVCSTERLDAPIGKNGELFCHGEYLGLLIDIANDVMVRSREKLQDFHSFLEDIYI
jgi:tRNA wybutosine-synthesizing protein 3